jgi:cephalosporin hydroxylase
MNEIEKFNAEKANNIKEMAANPKTLKSALDFVVETAPYKYSYNFSWLGRPIIQFPQDMIAMQELIWSIAPELIIETGVAHGGSLIYYASLLELIGNGKVLGIDIDIRPHNRREIEGHRMAKRIELLEGSSISEEVINKVMDYASGKKPILVILDSNHTHEHVLQELKLYSPLVTVGSYIVVFDTLVEDLPPSIISGERPWTKGNNPKTAVRRFLSENSHFEIDRSVQNKLLITVAPDGYLKRVK